MEYLFAFLALVTTVAFAVFIAVNIEKGKPWAFEIAQAVSLLDPNSLDHPLRHRPEGRQAETVAVAADIEQPTQAGNDGERLAA
jgi:hypothetical protein